ncbi:MAG: hypothetical protein H6518_15575 [Microthrixaceae bacterium]|nr:hypothetical protein [Microthrixaceae bacterium]
MEVRFLGGEPFPGRSRFRVWDLIDAGLRAFGSPPTARSWRDRERVLDHFPVSVALSLDRVTARPSGHPRRASYDRLWTHLARFHRYTRERGTDLGLTFCLMRRNWHEFGDYLLLADRWDAGRVNTSDQEPVQPVQPPLGDPTSSASSAPSRSATTSCGAA